MRGLVIILSAFVLAACDSGTVPSPSERMNERGDPAAPVIADNAVELRAEGLAAGSEAFFFSSGMVEVRYALGEVLGPDAGIVTNMECGAGPIETATFLGGLTVNFQQGMLVGWNLGQSEDPEAEKIKAAGTVQLGTLREEVAATPGFQPLDGSTLGEEFALGGKIGGFIEEDKVSMLYAGTQCFFR